MLPSELLQATGEGELEEGWYSGSLDVSYNAQSAQSMLEMSEEILPCELSVVLCFEPTRFKSLNDVVSHHAQMSDEHHCP